MNKIYRIVWSQARNAFIVAHEMAKARGKSSSSKKAVVQAVAASLLGLSSAHALADSCAGTQTISGAITNDQCVLGGGESLTVDGAGSILVGNPFISAVLVNGSTGGGITNAGTISGTINGARGILVDGGSTLNGSIVNSGSSSLIHGGNTKAGIDAMYAAITGGISNAGTIEGNSGIQLNNATVSGAVSNAGTISGINGNGLGVSSSTVDDDIINGVTGVMDGGYAGMTIQQGSTVTGNIINHGTISSSTQRGMVIDSSIVNDVTNSGSGVISGLYNGVLISGDVNSLLNQGTISSSNTSQGSGVDISGIVSSVTNDTNASISGYYGLRLSGTGSVSNITNSGAIIGNQSNGIIIDSSADITGAILNTTTGTITGANNGIQVGGVYASTYNYQSPNYTQQLIFNEVYGSGSVASITNTGLIDGGTRQGIDVYGGNVSGAIVNQSGGTVSGGANGIRITTGWTTGFVSSSDPASHVGTVVSISNNGLIIGTSDAGISVEGGSLGSVNNQGTITGNVAGIKVVGITEDALFWDGSTTQLLSNYFSAAGTLTGGITNSGTIGGDFGIQATGAAVIGSITNSGTGTVIGTISGVSTGIYIRSATVTGAITNDGLIEGLDGMGIHAVDSEIGDGITNNGTVTATFSATSYVGGIAIKGGTSGAIVNEGLIQVDNTNGAYYAGGIAVVSAASVTGGIINNGTIDFLNGQASSSAAIYVSESDVSGGITNSGTISVDAALGLYVYNATITGGFVNSGSGQIAGGVYLGSFVSLDGITNSGAISGLGRTIWIDGASLDNILNQSGGMISVSGNNYQGAIYLTGGIVTGDVTNEAGATISGQGATMGGFYHAGMYISDGLISGSINNSGVITSEYLGIYNYYQSAINNLNNSGTIFGSYAGIFLSNNSTIGSLTNSGTISSGGDAIYVDNSSTLNDIVIAGDNTAKFIGDVFAQNTDVEVASGATYTMDDANHFDVQSFTNNGTLGVAAGGTGSITGDYTQDAAGVFRVNITDDTTYSQLVVTGTATIAGTLDVDVESVNTLVAGDTLVDVLSADTLSGSFADITDNSALLNFEVVDLDDGTIDLSVAQARSILDAVTAAHFNPGHGAAGVLTYLSDHSGDASSDLNDFITSLNLLSTDQEISAAVARTLPLLTGGSGLAISHLLSSTNHIVQARQDGNRGMSTGDGFLGDKNVWLKPFGSWANQSDAQSITGYDANSTGIAVGVDGIKSDQLRLGAAFVYAQSNVDANDALQTADINSYQFVGYGSYSLDDKTEINFQADIGLNNTQGVRHPTSVLTAKSDFDSTSSHASVGVAHNYTLNDNTTVAPSLRADYTHISGDGYTETGAGGLNDVVQADTYNTCVVSVDGKLNYTLNDHAVLTANLGVGYDTLNEQAAVTSRYLGGGSEFVTSGLKPDATIINAGIGYVANTQNGMEITAKYDVETRDDFTNQTVSVKMRWPF